MKILWFSLQTSLNGVVVFFSARWNRLSKRRVSFLSKADNSVHIESDGGVAQSAQQFN